MIEQPPMPRPAAVLIPVRDGTRGIEVILVQRTHHANFLPGTYVFPGGALDTTDFNFPPSLRGTPLAAMTSGPFPSAGGELAHRVAAIRECFEESGLLFAYDHSGGFIDLQNAIDSRKFSAYRKQMAKGELTFPEICRANDLRLATDKLVYFGHWITPSSVLRRYDTRFFIAIAPERQLASHDNSEIIDHLWMTPVDALERHHHGDLNLVLATAKMLTLLTRFHDTEALAAYASALTSIPTIMARAAVRSRGRHYLAPDDDAYAEVGKLDPTESGNASSEIRPGIATRLSNRVRRIASPGLRSIHEPGTNTYLLGAGGDIAIIDPGPPSETHVRTLLAQAGGRIRWIFVTHTHDDHSPAAMLLKAETGAELLGMSAPRCAHQDQSFVPDRILSDGEDINVAGCTLRAIHTPGHASNHLCYLLEDERLLFTGDHMIQGSTVVINPPDGNMVEYLASLRKVQLQNVAYLAPGHGFLMDQPSERIERLLAHRHARESTVFETLCRVGPTTIDVLVPLVYADVPANKHSLAARSLYAHLIKLRTEGHVTEKGGAWQPAAWLPPES